MVALRQLIIRQELGIIRQLLTPHQRIVCAAYWYDGQTAREIGRRFGIHRRSVHQCVYRARKRIRSIGIHLPKHPLAIQPPDADCEQLSQHPDAA